MNQIILMDGGSTDGTVEYALEHGYEVHVQKQKGLRLGFKELYPKITGDIIITFSPDGNSIPELLPALIQKMKEGYDMTVVSRYLGEAKSYDDTPITRLGNFLFTKIINILFGGKYTDALVLYRAYKKKVPKDLRILDDRSELYERLIGKFISWEPQLSVRCAEHKMWVCEIPGDEPPRISADNEKGGVFLPVSKIHHFKSGFACLYMFCDEFLRK